jgi:hypothetical protein
LISSCTKVTHKVCQKIIQKLFQRSLFFLENILYVGDDIKEYENWRETVPPSMLKVMKVCDVEEKWQPREKLIESENEIVTSRKETRKKDSRNLDNLEMLFMYSPEKMINTLVVMDCQNKEDLHKPKFLSSPSYRDVLLNKRVLAMTLVDDLKDVPLQYRHEMSYFFIELRQVVKSLRVIDYLRKTYTIRNLFKKDIEPISKYAKLHPNEYFVMKRTDRDDYEYFISVNLFNTVMKKSKSHFVPNQSLASLFSDDKSQPSILENKQPRDHTQNSAAHVNTRPLQRANQYPEGYEILGQDGKTMYKNVGGTRWCPIKESVTKSSPTGGEEGTIKYKAPKL